MAVSAPICSSHIFVCRNPRVPGAVIWSSLKSCRQGKTGPVQYPLLFANIHERIATNPACSRLALLRRGGC